MYLTIVTVVLKAPSTKFKLSLITNEGYKWRHIENTELSVVFICVEKLKKKEEWVLEEVVKLARRQNLANGMYICISLGV